MEKISMPVARANVGFTNLSDPKLLKKSSSIQDGISTAPFFKDPPVAMPDLLSPITAFQEGMGMAGSKSTDSIAAKNAARALLISALMNNGNYVTLVANNNVSIIRASRYEVSTRQPAQPLAKPQNIKAEEGINLGQIITSVDAVKGAKAYSHEYKALPAAEDAPWTVANCTHSKCTIKGLTRQTEYIFRVGAIGTREQITYSDTVTRVAQ